VNIIFVLDISRSMLAEDITPNRLESAKSTLASFLSRERGNRVGLIVFAGKPFTTAPLSYDYGALRTIIRSLSVNYILQDIDGLSGTAFGDALLIAGEMFGSGTSASGNIIIALTDGRANTGIDPLLASQLLRESGIRVFPIGIGSTSGTTLFVTNQDGKREYFRDSTGSPLIADLDEATLEKVAEITG
jgi:Ca-activated chloride channel family protein